MRKDRKQPVMKAALVLAMAAGLQVVHSRAPEARTFEGVNLDELWQKQRLRDMPEIYERPANEPRFRLRKAVVQIPLGTAWLSFNAESNVFYLNNVPGENAAIYFGPVAGDAFEVFKLEEKFINALRKNYAPDVEYRLALMVRTENKKLRERALRIMTAGLVADVSVATRVSHLPRFREATEGLNGDDVAPLRAAIAETEKRFSESIPTLPDSAYSPGNDELARQGKLEDWMKPGVAVPDAAWGEASNGLRAAAVFSTTEPKLGQEISVWLLVENASDKEIRFSAHDVIQTARPKIIGADGKEVPTQGSWFTGLSPIRHHKLKPGERLTVAKKTLFFDDKNNVGNAGFGSNRAPAGPGEFRVRYESILGNGYAKADWGGQLTTAETKIIVAGDGRAAVAEPK
jgi:hypothetical protein